MKKSVFIFLLFVLAGRAGAQRIIVTFAWMPVGAHSEHGFLPGRPFKYYPATRKYDLGGKRLRIELHDERDSLKLKRLDCAKVSLTNTSEFEGRYGTRVMERYIDSLFAAANVVLDTAATDVLKVNLQALDSRLVGVIVGRAHGLCKMSVEWRGNTHNYCVDITDKDPHSPVSSSAWITRETATRVITAAAIREVLESILTDLEFDK